MESYTTNSKVILEAKQTLKELAKNNQITLNWIPGHEGHMGNEIADRLAKRGASQVMMGPKPSVPIQNNSIKNSIREWCKQKHQKTWSQQTDCRQTKWTNPQVGEWCKDLMKLKTQDLRIGTQLLTGHANLQRHRYLMKLEESPTCPKCKENEETTIHLLTECPAFAKLRWEELGQHYPKKEEIQKLKLSKLFKLARKIRRWKEINNLVYFNVM